MKKIFILVVFMMLGLLSNCNECMAQKVEITLQDLKNFNQAVVERDSYKLERDEAIRQSKAWQDSSNRWQGLYESEKKRADIVQEGRITACDEQTNALGKANLEYKMQSESDRKRISELEFDNRKLRENRKYYFGAGFLVGGLTGYSVGHKFSF